MSDFAERLQRQQWRREHAGRVIADITRVSLRILDYENDTPHAHQIRGLWDQDGRPCVRCADYDLLRLLHAQLAEIDAQVVA